MNRILKLMLLIALHSAQLMAQNDNSTLILQSPHGQTVKLMWFFKTWNGDYKGFNIKRREGFQKDWVKINNKPIVPEIMLKKNISKF